jgi:hypothetical protein
MTSRRLPRIGILWRGERQAGPQPVLARVGALFEALAQRGIEAGAVLYEDDALEDVRAELLQCDGVLVWVDPISEGRDRSRLDPLLRDVASRGVWVSTHPDIIIKMGTKDVLVKTRDMAWGTDCHLYATMDEMAAALPQRLASGPRVLKQYRGNGGNGVWKVSLQEPGAANEASNVEVLHAQRDSPLDTMSLAGFIERCRTYFEGGGCMIDQPYQARLPDGMIRCYLVGDRVAGFGHQFVTALLPPPAGTFVSPTPPPRLYYGPDKPEFQALKALLESGWVAEMQRLLATGEDELPLLWDADFLYGPRDAEGQDTYVLCEINVSAVYPFPDEAVGPLAEAAAARCGLKP